MKKTNQVAPSRKQLLRGGWGAAWATLIPLSMALLGSCAAKNGEQTKTAATGTPAKVPSQLPPIPGEVAPEPRGRIGPFERGIYSMATTDGMVAVAVADALSVRLFDSGTGQSLGELPSPTKNLLGLRFSPDGKHLSALSRQQDEAYVWDVVARTPARTVRSSTKLWSALPLRGGAELALGGERGLLSIAAVETGAVVRAIPVDQLFRSRATVDKLTVYGLGLSRSGQWLGAVVSGQVAVVVDLARKDSIRFADGDDRMQLSAIEFAPDDGFMLVRGSSFAPPRMVKVGGHPEGRSDSAAATTSSAACGAAIIPTGLLGYALCLAITSGMNNNSEAAMNSTGSSRGSSGAASRDGSRGGSVDNGPTEELAGLSGELMLWRLSDPAPVVAKTFGKTFEQMAWSRDSTRVAVIVNGLQGGEFVKRVQVYQRSQITPRSGVLPAPVETLTLGRADSLLLGAVAADQAALFMARAQGGRPDPANAAVDAGATYAIERWSVPSLRSESDDEGKGEAIGEPSTAGGNVRR